MKQHFKTNKVTNIIIKNGGEQVHCFQSLIILVFIEWEHKSIINWPQMAQDLVPNLKGLPFLTIPDVQKEFCVIIGYLCSPRLCFLFS